MRSCSSCGEALTGEALSCPTCAPGSPPLRRLLAGELAVVLCALLVVALMAAAVVVPTFHGLRSQGASTKCANNLRQIGLAALQYSDDTLLLPHVGATRELDRGIDSPDTPRTMRLLMWSAYLETPEAFVCPASSDIAAPLPPGQDPRTWSWSGLAPTDPGQSPLRDGVADPALSATTELSYGWTRRGLGATAPGSTILAADRALDDGARAAADLLAGNHEEGFYLLRADASVRLARAGQDPEADPAWLAGTARGEGCLPVREGP